MNSYELSWVGIQEAPWAPRVPDFLERVLEHLGIDHWELSLVFCSPEEMRSINASYRRKDEPTDVLSFPQFEPGDLALDGGSGAEIAVGDIIVCPAAVAENAQSFSIDFDEELRRVLIHGILHLKGLDHRSNDPEEPMLLFQEEILSLLKEYTVST